MFRYGCIYVSGLIQAFFILPLNVVLLPAAARQFGFSVVFSGWPPCVGCYR